MEFADTHERLLALRAPAKGLFGAWGCSSVTPCFRQSFNFHGSIRYRYVIGQWVTGIRHDYEDEDEKIIFTVNI